jgi:hypothetical protein
MRFIAVLAVAGSLLACSPSPAPTTEAEARAGAAGPKLERLVALSGPSPFAPAGCGTLDEPVRLAAGIDPWEFGDESDVSIAANPANPDHLVAAWGQDAALGVVTAVSFDGGRRWQRQVVPSLTHCEDMASERVMHSRLSFGPDGVLYLGNELVDGFYPDPRQLASQRVSVSVSRDGGIGWTTRFVDLGAAEGPKGFSTLMAEPDVAGGAVVTWHWEARAPGGTTFVSRTTDGGATWTRHVARQGLQGEFPFNRILALRDGRLLLISADLTVPGIPAAAVVGMPVEEALTPILPPAGTSVHIQVSNDKGVTWSDPVAIGSGRAQQWAAAVEAPDGTIYVGWLVTDNGQDLQVVSRSGDGGATWSSPVAVARHDLGHASLAVSPDGHVGFAYLDHRRDAARPEQRDAWLAYSTDRGATWSEFHIAGPFTLATGDLGYVQETVGTAEGFAATVLLGPPYAVDGRTDVFFADIRLRERGR